MLVPHVIVDLDTLIELLTVDMLARMKKVAEPLLGAGEAEDAVSEAVTYLLARCQRSSIEMDNPGAYLVRCSYNAATRIARQRRRHTPPLREGDAIAEGTSLFGGSTLGGVPSTADELDVAECVRRLPERCRSAIVLQQWGDLSNTDIAAAMGISDKAVEAHLRRARALIKGCLQLEDGAGS